MRNRAYLIFLFFLVAAGGLILITTSKQNHVAATVTLGDAGFAPKTLTIHEGDTVEFRSTLKRDFWPASDLHPTHELYKEFDPQQPVKQGSTWAFTFTKIGKWPYHDHLFPYFRGIITVAR